MTQRIDTVREPAPEFIRKLGTIREPIDLVSEGTVVARLTAPSALTDEEWQRILDNAPYLTYASVCRSFAPLPCERSCS